MTNSAKLLAAASAVGLSAAPAVAQYYPQQQYPQQAYPQEYPQQQYPQQQYPQQQYPQNYPGYGYDQDYGESVVGQIIDQLLGNRYDVTDRQAVSRCAREALIQARQQYGGYGYAQPYGYQQGYNYQPARRLRITSITSVERRYNGLRVRGTIGPAYGGYGGYGGYGQYGNQYRGYGYGNFSFRCNVDYSGAVTGLRVTPYNYRRY